MHIVLSSQPLLTVQFSSVTSIQSTVNLSLELFTVKTQTLYLLNNSVFAPPSFRLITILLSVSVSLLLSLPNYLF